MPDRQALEAERLAWAYADLGELVAYFLLVRRRWRELQRKVEILEEVFLHEFLVDLWEGDGRRGRRRRLLQIGRKGLHLISGLDFNHVFHVARVEQLGPVAYQRELRGRLEYLLDARRSFAFPVGSDDQVVASLIAGGTAANVAVIICVAIDELNDVVTPLFYRRDRQHDRFRAQVPPQE